MSDEETFDASAPNVIDLRAVSKTYGRGEAEVRALDRIDLTIRRGEFTAVMGPSGSGKSTAMNIIGCLDQPTAGSYRFNGVEVGKLDRKQRALLRRHYLGFVFQGFNLLARTSAVENVELPLIYRGLRQSERRPLALKALERVDLAGQGRTYAFRAFRRSAAARCDCPRDCHRSCRSSCGRADRQSRYNDQRRDHELVGRSQYLRRASPS